MYKKLIKMQRFSKQRIKQLWDDCRIFAAWYSSIKHGKIIHDRRTKKILRLQDCVNRYAHARGLLLALGYIFKHNQKSKQPTAPEFKELFKKAWPKIKKWYKYYKGKVIHSRS